MAEARFRFYEELNDFLPPQRRKVEFSHRFKARASVKDMIESLGVPHPEIDLILANGDSVGFDYIVCDGDRLSVYPTFEALDISPLVRLRPAPLRTTRFVLDTHLGTLARYLRLLGFDTLYANHWDDVRLAALSRDQRRILLTRDCGLLKRASVTHGLFVRATAPRQQLHEIVSRLDLYRALRPFTRCLRCNGELAEVDAGVVAARLPNDIRQSHDKVRRCRSCDRLFWRGSHYGRLQALIQEIGEGRKGAQR